MVLVPLVHRLVHSTQNAVLVGISRPAKKTLQRVAHNGKKQTLVTYNKPVPMVLAKMVVPMPAPKMLNNALVIKFKYVMNCSIVGAEI